jgi:hypothetical protein
MGVVVDMLSVLNTVTTTPEPDATAPLVVVQMGLAETTPYVAKGTVAAAVGPVERRNGVVLAPVVVEDLPTKSPILTDVPPLRAPTRTGRRPVRTMTVG